jgi:hypothetical protein
VKPEKVRVPQPIRHKASGQDVVFLRQADGRRRMVYLGPGGSPEAARRYREVLAEHLAGKTVATSPRKVQRPSSWPTVGHLVAEFLLHCERFYIDEHGRKSKGIISFVHAMAPNGTATVHQPVPFDPGLIGLPLNWQWFVSDPAATSGLAASRAAQMVIF